MELVWPFFAVLSFGFTLIYKLGFAWWLDPWTQRKANRQLWEDVQTNLHFICAEGQLVERGRVAILPFDYAEVRVPFGNVLFFFVCGRGELNISLSPRFEEDETYTLSAVMAALDPTIEATAQKLPNTLPEASSFLRPHLEALNAAFSTSSYPAFRKKLQDQKGVLLAATKQLEWQLNQNLKRSRPLRG
jgi:hypothetical protein